MAIYSKFLFLFLLPLYLLFPMVSAAQDIKGIEELSKTELIRYNHIRSLLLEEGYLTDTEPSTRPLPFAASTSVSEDSFLFDAWFMGKSLQVETTNTRTLKFRPDGERVYVVARGELLITEYHLSTPWDITTAIPVRSLDLSSVLGTGSQEDQAPRRLYFRRVDGRKMWVFNRTEIWEYTLSTPWDVSTATVSGYKDLIDEVVRGHDIDFKPDGTVLYIDDRILGVVFQYTLSTPWDVQTANRDYVLDISSEQISVRGTEFSPNGSRMFLLDTGNEAILEYGLTTPYELRTATYFGPYSVSAHTTNPEGLAFKPDFKNFYVTSTFNNTLLQYKISNISSTVSDISADRSDVTANNQNRATITVTVKDSDGDLFPDVEVELNTEQGSSGIEFVNSITNANGEAVFEVFKSSPATVTYSATASRSSESVTLSDDLVIDFLPAIPVILSTTNVTTSEFTMNWEVVEHAESYIIDVAEDDVFSEFQSGFESLDIGFATNYRVTGLSPGRQYYFTVRAKGNNLESKNSETGEVTTFPEVPVASAPSNMIATSFTARWLEAEGAEDYIIDVARDESFTDFVSGYEALNVGNRLDYQVTGLEPEMVYFYRVRATAFSKESGNSGSVSANTVGLNFELTNITSSQLRVLANGVQENEITVTLRDTEGKPIIGEKISISDNSESIEYSETAIVSDESGKVIFSVTNTVVEKVSFRAHIGNYIEIGTISLEFLPTQNELVLGNNYPNPFRGRTIIPLHVPRPTEVRIVISNSVGARVQIVINEVLNQGYYEIPVELSGHASGVYFYQLFTNNEVETLKMLLVK